MSEIKIFESEQFGTIRTALTENGEPLFCLADLCEALVIENHRNVKSRIDDEDVCLVDTLTNGGKQKIIFITEAGMWLVIMRSDSMLAKPMQKWVTKEVLPAIRKTGKYELKQQLPTTYIDALKALVISEEAKQIAQAKVIELEPKGEVYDKITESSTLLTFNDAAKSIGIGRNKMMNQLRESQILRANNTPYQSYIQAGNFEVKIKPINGINITQTFVTGKGLVWLSKMFSKA